MGDNPRYAVIFDLDGTLIDSLADIAMAMNHCLEAFGAPTWPISAYRGFIGGGALNAARLAAPDGADVAGIAALFERHYTERYADQTRVFEGTHQALEALRSADIPLAVLSNKPDAATRRVVARAFAPGTFQVVAGSREGVPRKPDPAVALEQADILGAPPRRTFFVGDMGVDVATARAAGMRPVGVGWGLCTPDELRDAGAGIICPTPGDLRDLPALWGARRV
jgi:phosphoglycolate phosphatase